MKRAWIALAAVVLILSSAVLAQSAPPSADTYSNSSHSDTGVNYGSAVLLVVQTGGNNSYLQFNLSTIPSGATVNKATLRLYVDALVTNGSFDVYQLNKSWSETTLTYNNAPPLGASATGGHPVAVSKVNQFVLVDITSLVQGWQNGTIANNGIALATTTSVGSFSFDSKESIFTSHQPELEIVLNAPAGPTGPQGPQGPQGLTGNTGATGAAGPIGPVGATGNQGVAGPIGPIGPAGPIGFSGPQGAAGNNGAPGTNGTGFNFRGLFLLNTSGGYNLNDVVTDTNGSSYVAIQNNTGATDPASDTTDWTLIAQAGTNGANGAAGSNGAPGTPGTPGTNGTNGTNGVQGVQGAPGIDGATGPAGPAGPQGATGDANARMIFPSFYPGGLTGSWVGGQFTLDQAITVLRIAVVAKTPTQSTCPAAVFRLTNGTKGQDLVLAPGQNWSDTGAMVMTFNVGDVLQASLRTGSICPGGPVGANYTGADANLLVEYKMQASGDTDACDGTSCSGFCTTTSSDPSNCGSCGAACASGVACASGACPAACGSTQQVCNGACTNVQSDPNNCGQCSDVCKMGTICASGQCSAPLQNGSSCVSGSQCSSGYCTQGICVAAPCPTGQTSCSGVCTNTQTDPNNCGVCALKCGSGQSCINAACETVHSNGVGQTFTDSNPLGTYTSASAIEAGTAYELSIGGSSANVTDGNQCGGTGPTFVCATNGGSVVFCWGYSGSITGQVSNGSCPFASLGTWN
jgi:hypothetical protein